MNKTWRLYKAFSSNLEMPKPTGEKKVKLYNRFGMIAFIGIMIPISVVVGYVAYAITNLMYGFDGNTYGLLTEIDLISAFAMVFGMPLMFSVLFFSSDLQFLTALPITPSSLYAARFWHTFKAENVMTSNVLFAIYIGYFIASIKNAGVAEALHPVALIASVVGFFGSLLIPLIYCSIIALLLMLVLRRFNRVNIYYYTSVVILRQDQHDELPEFTGRQRQLVHHNMQCSFPDKLSVDNGNRNTLGTPAHRVGVHYRCAVHALGSCSAVNISKRLIRGCSNLK